MDDRSALVYDSRPKLRSPYVLCGLDGSLNAGNVSIGGIQYLIKHFKAAKFAEITTSRYHVYHVAGSENLRPVFKMDEGLIVETHFPNDHFFYATNPASEHDLVFFLGTEPNLNWEEYADNVVTLAGDLGSSRLYAFGAILDRSPYGREPRITCTCTSARVREEMAKYRVSFSSREGVATVNQMLLYACQKKGLDGVGMTARAPYYPEFNLAIEYSPRSIKAVLVRLNDLTHLGVNFDELDDAIGQIQGKLDSFRQQNPQFNSYMDELEKGYVEMAYQETLDMSPNEGVRLAEEFLRGNKDQRPGQ
jgi:proteasome assembly chaperone (PAC2) family protein